LFVAVYKAGEKACRRKKNVGRLYALFLVGEGVNYS